MATGSESSRRSQRRARAVAGLSMIIGFVALAAAPARAQDATDPAQSAETTTTVPADPMGNEAPGEEAPAVDITVPPKETYGDQPPYEPPPILWSSVVAAERKLAEARSARRDAIVEVRTFRTRLKQLELDQVALDASTNAALDELTAATARLQTRAVLGFQRFGSGSSPEPHVTDHRGLVERGRRSRMVDSALEVDELELDRLAELKAALGAEALGLLDRIRLVSDHLVDAELDVGALQAEIDQAQIEYEAFRAGSEVFIHGVTFPIAGPYSPPVDSFGAPRMTGTEDEHWHEGIDLFAPAGTPLVATERGVIARVGIGRLGGLKLWLKGESGSEWYYAHLAAFAPDLADGLVVEAGQVIGYVGNTGNAVGTPPHLHMQLHPDGADPVNPYPLLKVVSDLERAAAAAAAAN